MESARRVDDTPLDTANQEVGSEDVPEAERDTIVVESVDHDVFKLRSYQDEMLIESLKRNTIVVLNTGAGKTHIALARIRAEVEFDHSGKLVWFLAPTVALCNQQYKSVTTNLPAYQSRLLTSEDKVDRWTSQEVWDGVLKGMRIIISTYGVLYDALCHGFVKLPRLSLCVFDEAHHCMKKDPSNMIMQQFYRPAKAAGQPVPRILGLSASPVMNAKTGGLELLEANLDSHVITPRLHRSELMQFVHVPQLTKRSYPNLDDFEIPMANTLLGALTTMVYKYEIRKDPYVRDILKKNGPDTQAKMEKVLMSRKTYCTDQLNPLRLRAEVIARDISVDAADAYIRACCDKFLSGLQRSNADWMPELTDKEKGHLALLISELYLKAETSSQSFLSPKTQLLLQILEEEAGELFTGIIFVQQRAVVAALAEYLTSLPEIACLFDVGTFVGGSQSSKRKANIGDINDLKEQQKTLNDFRVGKKNLIIATSVLEEGIDVSSCQTVICFDAPLNLVSFVQRRGRARKKDSRYIILLADDDSKGEPAKWHRLEEEMKAAYENEFRNAQLAAELEKMEESDGRKYKVPSTNALLTLDNAKSHLYHFCATLQTSSYVDHRPTFSCYTDPADLINAEVILPACVNPKYRRAVSAHSWRTENAAMKDAAFEACVALHRGGLLNDHLLPLHTPTPEQARQDRQGTIQVAERIDPWSLRTSNTWYEHRVEVEIAGQPKTSMRMLLPVQCQNVTDIILHWSLAVKGVAQVRFSQERMLDAKTITKLQRDTETLLLSVLPSSLLKDARTYFAALFEPLSDPYTVTLSRERLPATRILRNKKNFADVGLVRLIGQEHSYVMNPASTATSHSAQLDVVKFPRKRDFLTKPTEESKKNQLTSLEVSISHCTIDVLPARYSVFAACIPSILHRVENAIIATRLQSTLLKPVGIENWQLISQATTSGNADFVNSYERLEYLGDSVLKFFTHVQLAAQYPDWPESYLTVEKGRTNGNASLSRAALTSGVDRYISTKRFTGNDWDPPTLPDAAKPSNATVERSTKTLADVVEALIGASYAEKGLEGALACIKIFLPGEEWYGLTECHKRLLQTVPELDTRTSSLDMLEQLIGYQFMRPALLLEATTHSSYSNNETLSYERLEFLGDSVLDQIIIPEIFAHQPGLKNHEMHRMRQSLANAHLLGVRCMELGIDQERLDPVKETADSPTLIKTSHRFHLHDFLRCEASIKFSAQAAVHRYKTLRPQLLHALEHGHEYPWPDLLALRSPKCFCDMIESILGAIYVDSEGNLDICRAFVERCGILKLLRRFLNDNVMVGYPKETLGLLADKQKVEYVSKESELDLRSDKPRTWSCIVKIGEKEIMQVEDCCSKDEAEVRAAAEAVRLLNNKTDVVEKLQGLDLDEEMVDAD